MARSKQPKRNVRKPCKSSSASGEEEPSKFEPENDGYTTNSDTSWAGIKNSEDNADCRSLRNKIVKVTAEGKGKSFEKEPERKGKGKRKDMEEVEKAVKGEETCIKTDDMVIACLSKITPHNEMVLAVHIIGTVHRVLFKGRCILTDFGG
ncbi:hypothetical protein FN846DRAFT_895518 [Sphaerosporella brunnea]|uniref:Uncharacterized protein n=1 Tax=Sphaerosporella brunnea TaxID=1250544 RepID=A0A5J5EE80_9PEZI|nr:hypothetical protein FN846DRAFT_895518 [Sphaerosporella brunnea]